MGQAGSASRDDVSFPTSADVTADLHGAGAFNAGAVASQDDCTRSRGCSK